MLTIQNSSPSFNGRFIHSDILAKRINEIQSPAKLNSIYEALKQMDATKDGKIFKYAEKTYNDDYFYNAEATFANITNEKGDKLKEVLFRSKGECDNGNGFTYHKSISDFICEFVEEHYPKNISENEVIRKNIFDMLG